MNNNFNGGANAQGNLPIANQEPQQPQPQHVSERMPQAPGRQNTQHQNRQPENTIRDGSLKATIWEQNGKNGAYYTTDFAKTYRDKQGNLQDGRSFAANELLRLAELARQAHHDVTERRRAAYQRHQQAVRAGLVPAKGNPVHSNAGPEYDR